MRLALIVFLYSLGAAGAQTVAREGYEVSGRSPEETVIEAVRMEKALKKKAEYDERREEEETRNRREQDFQAQNLRNMSVWYPPEYRTNLATIPRMEITYQFYNETYSSWLTKTGGSFSFDVLVTPWRVLRNVTLTQSIGNGSGGDFYYENNLINGFLSWPDIPPAIQVTMGHIPKTAHKAFQ